MEFHTLLARLQQDDIRDVRCSFLDISLSHFYHAFTVQFMHNTVIGFGLGFWFFCFDLVRDWFLSNFIGFGFVFLLDPISTYLIIVLALFPFFTWPYPAISILVIVLVSIQFFTQSYLQALHYSFSCFEARSKFNILASLYLHALRYSFSCFETQSKFNIFEPLNVFVLPYLLSSSDNLLYGIVYLFSFLWYSKIFRKYITNILSEKFSCQNASINSKRRSLA